MSPKRQQRQKNPSKLHSGVVLSSASTYATGRGSTGQGATSTLPYPVIFPRSRRSDWKRQRDISGSRLHSETSGHNQPALSTILLRASDSPTPDFSPTKRGSSKIPVFARRSSRVAREKSDITCGICTGKPERRKWKFMMGGEPLSCLHCKTCRLEFHSSCIFMLLHCHPQSMVFCPWPSNNSANFYCSACIRQPKEGFDGAVEMALEAFISTYNAEKRNEGGTDISYIPDGVDLSPVREERYNGLEEDEVRNLVRKLEQSILDCDIEIQDVVDRFDATSDRTPQMPLAKWAHVDPNSSIILGKQWFNIDEAGRTRARRHAPVTAALRSMLRTPDGDSLMIPLTLYRLTRSQVHMGLVSWFAFDIIDNQFDIYGWSTMKSARAMMAAVVAFWHDRWPGTGRQYLQEVQLRTWYKSEFQPRLLLNDDNFKGKFEAFLEPLIKDFDKVSSWSDARNNVIEITFRLWSYLQCHQGKVILIQPDIGDSFDPDLHEAYDEEDIPLDLKHSLGRKILWISCRGFQYEDGEEKDGSHTVRVKARVIVQ